MTKYPPTQERSLRPLPMNRAEKSRLHKQEIPNTHVYSHLKIWMINKTSVWTLKLEIFDRILDVAQVYIVVGRFCHRVTILLHQILVRPLPTTTSTGTILPKVDPTTSNPCAFGMCANYGKCEVHRGRPRCVCPSSCPGPKRPICGSDGVTYASQCDLEKESCTSKKEITPAKIGFCGMV